MNKVENRKNKYRSKELVVKSKTENLSAIREFIRSAAAETGAAQDQIDKIILAVDEACTNIIKHAYKFFPEGEIQIKLNYTDEKFNITILDNGASFDPSIVPEPDIKKFYNQRKVGGLGIYLMRTLMDEVEYSSIPGKYNKVHLSKNLNLRPS